MHERVQGPSAKPDERATAVGPARAEAAPAPNDLIGLQRDAGNQAVLALLARRTVQRAADPWAQPEPAADAGVDVRMRVQQLRLAIRYEPFPPKFQIDRSAVASALDGVTREDARAIKAAFRDQAKWELADVIQAEHEIGDGYKVPNNLAKNERRHLLMLLAGTAPAVEVAPAAEATGEMLGAAVETLGALTGRADEAKQVTDIVRKTVGAKVGESLRRGDEEASAQARRRRWNAVATAFRAALDKNDVEAALAFLKRPKAGRDALAEAYLRVFSEPLIVAATIRLRGNATMRAIALMGGDVALAERLALEQDVAESDKVAKQAAEVGGMGVVDDYFAAKQKQAKRKIEARIEHIAGSIDPTTSVGRELGRQHLAAVLGHDMGSGDIHKRIGADSNAVLKAIISGDAPAELGAKLARKDAEGTLKPADVEAALRQLRALVPASEDQDATVDGYFQAFQASFNANNKKRTLGHVLAGQPRTFDELMSAVGVDPADLARNRALFVEGGKLPEWQELYFALTRDPKDMPRARQILGSKTRRGVADLTKVYADNTPGRRSLESDLLGAGAEALEAVTWFRGEAREAVAERRELLQGGEFESEATDELARLAEEGAWLFGRITSLEGRVMENRGTFAEVRDWMGNVEHELVVIAMKDAAMAKRELDRALAAAPAEVSVAQRQVRDLRRIHYRLNHAVDAYKEATKRAFAEFVELAVMVVSTAATLGQGGFIVMALRGTAARIGTKLALRAEDYSVDEFFGDLRGGLAEMAGGAVVNKLYKPFATTWAQKALDSGLNKTLAGRVAAKLGPLANWEAEEQIESIIGGLVEGKGIDVMGVEGHVSAVGQLGLSTGMGAGVDALKRRPRGGGTGGDLAPTPDTQPLGRGEGGDPSPGTKGDVGSAVPESATGEALPKQKDARERHEAQLAVAAAKRRIRELDAANEPAGSMYRLVAAQQLQDARDAFLLAHGRYPEQPPPLPDKWDTEMVVQDSAKTSRGDADRIFDNMFENDPWREVGLYRNTVTGEYIVIQGRKSNVSVELDPHTRKPMAPRGQGEAQRWKEVLDTGSDVGHWELMAHSHPNFKDTGGTRPANYYPSWRPGDGGDGGDVGAIVRESKRTGQPRESKLIFNTPDGRKTTTFGYDPAHAQPFYVIPPDGQPLRFVDGRAYWDHMQRTFPELVTPQAGAPEPTTKEPDEYHPVVPEATPAPPGDVRNAATLDEPVATVDPAAGRRRDEPEIDSDLEREAGRPASRPRTAAYEPREASRYQEVGRASAGVSGAKILIDRSATPPKKVLFKAVSQEVEVPRARDRGIEAGTYSTRAVAAEITAEALGIRTPHVELVTIGGERGTVTEWWDQQSLADYVKADPGGFNALRRTEAFRASMARIDTLDYVINQVDRVQNLGNYLIEFHPDGTFKDLHPIDNELSFTSTRERAKVGAYAHDLPESYDDATVKKLEALGRDRNGFIERIAPLVGDEAVPGVLHRLDALLADMRVKRRTGTGGAR